MVMRKIAPEHRTAVIEMMQTFYASDAVLSNGSDEIFENDVNACIRENPYLEGYVFENNGEIMGYTMLAKSFSTEFGKPCIWIEDLYLKPQFRSMGISKLFFETLFSSYGDAIFRLEVEEDNCNAIAAYKKNGFNAIPYMEMIKR